MSLDYLEELESSVGSGVVMFACPVGSHNEWFISSSLDELRPRAQRTADNQRFEANIYRLCSHLETTAGDYFFVVRKILDNGPRGEPNIRWCIVDTREAAEMLRDVSRGPSPYFGAMIEETFKPR